MLHFSGESIKLFIAFFFSKVLVYDDVMGTWSGHKAKFVRRFANLKEVRDNAVQAYGEAVRDGSFPDPEAEGYAMDKVTWERFLETENAPASD